jgi:hypothetical protein
MSDNKNSEITGQIPLQLLEAIGWTVPQINTSTKWDGTTFSVELDGEFLCSCELGAIPQDPTAFSIRMIKEFVSLSPANLWLILITAKRAEISREHHAVVAKLTNLRENPENARPDMATATRILNDRINAIGVNLNEFEQAIAVLRR